MVACREGVGEVEAKLVVVIKEEVRVGGEVGVRQGRERGLGERNGG